MKDFIFSKFGKKEYQVKEYIWNLNGIWVYLLK